MGDSRLEISAKHGICFPDSFRDQELLQALLELLVSGAQSCSEMNKQGMYEAITPMQSTNGAMNKKPNLLSLCFR